MKQITERHYSDLIETIIKDKQKQYEKVGQEFSGIDGDDLLEEVTKRLGGDWCITNERPVKFTKADINAVAGARYFRKGGVTLLMGLAIIILCLSIVARFIGLALSPLSLTLYYTVCGIVTLAFLWFYSHGQAKIRRELWRQLGREESLEK